MIQQVLFEISYLIRRTPWDTGITPPELYTFLDAHPPGRALDLGCGTGTNAITMSQYGWQVVGVDISKLAIRRARKKARKSGFAIDFFQEDVTAFHNPGKPFDLVLDIGCFHSLSSEMRTRYVANLRNLLRPTATYMLYSWLQDADSPNDIPPDEAEIYDLLSPFFECRDVSHGTDRQRASAWFTFQRKT